LSLFSWDGEGDDVKMLGDMVFEGRGKTVSMRVLPNGKLEQTVMMQGMFLGDEFSTTWTSEAEVRPDGTGYTEFHGFYTTKKGGMGRYTGMGNGVMAPDGSQIWRGVVCYSNPPGMYSRFNGIAVVWELQADKEGNVHNKGWEWK
jgi:hypothetical protein